MSAAAAATAAKLGVVRLWYFIAQHPGIDSHNWWDFGVVEAPTPEEGEARLRAYFADRFDHVEPTGAHYVTLFEVKDFSRPVWQEDGHIHEFRY